MYRERDVYIRTYIYIYIYMLFITSMILGGVCGIMQPALVCVDLSALLLLDEPSICLIEPSI